MTVLSFILRPHVFEDEGKTRTAALLHFILVFGFVFNLFTSFTSILLGYSNAASNTAALFSLALMGSMFILLRKGHVALASFTLSIFSWATFAYASYQNTGVLNPSFGAQTLTILMAGLLINGWAAMGFAALSSVFGLLLVQAANRGVYPLQVGNITVVTAWVGATSTFCMTALFLGVGLRAFYSARRKVMEQQVALQQGETRYRLLVENASDIVFSIDREHKLSFLNRASRGTPADYRGRSIYDFLSSEGQDAFRAAVKHVFEQSSEVQVDTAIKGVDGKPVQYSVRLAPIREANQVIEIIAIARDVTEQLKAQELLRASEEQYRELFESNPHPMFLVDGDSAKFVAVNDSMVLKYGYTREEFSDMTLKDLLSPEDWALAVSRRQEFRGGKRESEISGPWHYRKKDGSIIQVEISSHRLEYNGRPTMMTATYDVTERMKAEAALRTSEERFRALIEQSTEVTGIIAPDGKVLFVSPSVEQFVGYTVEEITGSMGFDFTHPEDAALTKEVVERAIRNPGVTQEGRYRLVSKNGVVISVEVNVRDLSHIPAIGGIVFNVRNVTERQWAEEALRESEERFRALTEEAADVVGILDKDGDILFISPAIERITGHTPQELTGTPAINCVFQDDQSIVNELLERSARNPGVIQSAIFRDVHKDGSMVVVEATSRDMTQNQAIGGIVFNLRDITEQKRAEDALRASETQYRQLFDANPHPMYVLDLETLKFLDVNDATLDQYGYKRNEFLNMTTRDIRPPQDMTAVVNQVAKFQNNNMVYEVTGPWLHRKKDGTIIQVETAAHRLRYRGRDAVLIAAYDLTERLRAEAGLRRSEQLFSTIFHAVPVSIIILRQEDSRVVNVNDYLLKLTGYTREEIVGERAAELPVWEALDDPETVARSMAETSSISAAEFVWVTRSGERLSMVSSFLQIDMNDEPCVLGVLVDLTERERAEHARMDAERMQLEIYKEREVVELKEQFISTMSHEFRTPLAIILAAAESLQRYYERLKPERRQEHFYNIKHQVQYVTAMLDEVLTLGKARSGKVRFNPMPIPFVTFCQHLFEQVQLTDTDNHRFTFTENGNIGEVAGDEYLLQHILVNLLSNAIKYSPDGGEVRFGVSRMNGSIVIQVSDQGIGIPEQDQKYLFDAFFRASNTHKIKGTGLGLAIVKESVDSHGGTISCESVVGKGTTFTVCLPAS